MPTYGGGGGGFPSSVNRNIRYVHPNGSDSNAGTTWQQPLKYIKTAWDQLAALDGGTIYVADESVIAPNTNAVSGLHIFPEGSGHGSVAMAPMRVIGVDSKNSVPGFSFAPTVRIYGGAGNLSTEQDDPAIWLCGAAGQTPIYFENIRTQDGRNKPWRVGWDYAQRDESGAIVKPAITAAVRAAGVTTLTTEQYEFGITAIDRTTNIVTVTTDRPQLPISLGAQVYIDYTGAEFAPAWFTVVSLLGVDAGADSFTVASTGDDFADAAPVGTAESNCVAAGDYITTYSDEAEFPSSMYRVTSVDEDDILVEDLYGFAPRSASASEVDIGTFAAQDRRWKTVDRWQAVNVGGTPERGSETDDRFVCGPTVDLAATQFFSMDHTSFDGYNLPESGGNFTVRSAERRAAIFCAAGPQGIIGTGAFNFQYGQRGSFVIRCSPSFSNGLTIKHVNADNDDTVKPTPAVDVYNAAFASQFTMDDIVLSDNGEACPAIRSDTIDQYWSWATMSNVYGTIEGPGNTPYRGSPLNLFSDSSPNQTSRTGWYGSDRLVAGRHMAAGRGFGIVANPYTQPGGGTQDTASWAKSPGGITFTTTGIRDPSGGTNAVRITNNTGDDGTVTIFSAAVGGAPANGDFFAGGMWIRNISQGANHAFSFTVDNADIITFLDTYCDYPNGEAQGEWYMGIAGGPLTNASGVTAAATLELQIADGGIVDVYLPCVWRGDIDADNTAAEFAEWKTHLQPMWDGLPTGFLGTPPNKKVVLHGGMGTAARYTVGVATDEITLGAATGDAVELFDEEGNSLGVVAPLSFVVNP